jgi:hypothetical protein
VEHEPKVDDLLSANEEFAQANDKLAEENAGLKQQLSGQGAMINKLMKRFEAMEQQIGQDGTAHFDDTSLVRVEGKTLDDPDMLKKLQMEAFMEEMVTVEISEVSEEQADHGFPIFVNGQCEIFFRGERKAIKRKFVEGLARAKKTGYRNVLKVDRDTGEQEYVWPSKTGLRYPFSVIEDKNRMGADWLRSVLRQP